jgi:putative membrane protein
LEGEKEYPCTQFKEWIYVYFCGVCMGAADVVPGVSGGTVAFILGIYGMLLFSIQRFNFTALKLLFSMRFRDVVNHLPWRFFSALILGILTAMALLTRIFVATLNHPIHRIYLYAAFLGLVLGSVRFCSKRVKTWNTGTLSAMLIGGVIAASVTLGMAQPQGESLLYDVFLDETPVTVLNFQEKISNFDKTTKRLKGVKINEIRALKAKKVVHDQTVLLDQKAQKQIVLADLDFSHLSQSYFDSKLFFCGMIAVCALLLPGLSGSYLLVILGVYPLFLGAIADFVTALGQLEIHAEALAFLVNIGTGFLVGGFAFSWVLTYLLKHYFSQVIAALTGFILGALPAVWPFWQTEYYLMPLKLHKGPMIASLSLQWPEMTASISWVAFAIALVAFCFVLAIDRQAKVECQ